MGAMGAPLCPAPGPGVRGIHLGEARTLGVLEYTREEASQGASLPRDGPRSLGIARVCWDIPRIC